MVKIKARHGSKAGFGSMIKNYMSFQTKTQEKNQKSKSRHHEKIMQKMYGTIKQKNRNKTYTHKYH